MDSNPVTSWQIEGKKVEAVTHFIFLKSKVILHGECSLKIKRLLHLGRIAMTNLDNVLRSRDVHHFVNKGPSSHSYGCFDSHVWIWELDHKEDWTPENWCFWTGAWEDSRESFGQQGDQTSQSLRKSTLNIHWKDWCWSWSSRKYFCHQVWRTNSFEKTLMMGKTLMLKRKTEEEIVGWHHWINGHDFEQTLGNS